MDVEEKRGPGRPRKDDTKPDRRRKGNTGTLRQKLAVSEDDRDPNFAYRWINDTKSRVHDLTVKDDWELVDHTGGTARTEIVGTGANGEPQKAYLVRKPIEYHTADKAAAQAEIDKKVDAITAPASDPTSYGEVRIRNR